jgi:hypothetical protein
MPMIFLKLKPVEETSSVNFFIKEMKYVQGVRERGNVHKGLAQT